MPHPVGFAADLHLDSRNAGFDPAGKLVLQLLEGIGGEPAAAVYRYGLVDRPQKPGEWQVKKAAFQIPKRRVDGRNRHRSNAGTAQVANGRGHH